MIRTTELIIYEIERLMHSYLLTEETEAQKQEETDSVTLLVSGGSTSILIG